MIRSSFPFSVMHPRRSQLARRIAGFSLVEMLVVLTIIALVLGLVGPRVFSYLGKSRFKDSQAADRELRFVTGSFLSRRGTLSDNV